MASPHCPQPGGRPTRRWRARGGRSTHNRRAVPTSPHTSCKRVDRRLLLARSAAPLRHFPLLSQQGRQRGRHRLSAQLAPPSSFPPRCARASTGPW
eukprot:223128-Chlamydomonas_euryale.AAC.1